MKRRKIKKIRTTICIDEDIFFESGDYIYNLSAFVQECMRREIEKQKNKKLRITTIMSNEEKTSSTDVNDVDHDWVELLEKMKRKYEPEATEEEIQQFINERKNL